MRVLLEKCIRLKTSLISLYKVVCIQSILLHSIQTSYAKIFYPYHTNLSISCLSYVLLCLQCLNATSHLYTHNTAKLMDAVKCIKFKSHSFILVFETFLVKILYIDTHKHPFKLISRIYFTYKST